MMPVSIAQNIDKYFFNRKKDITLLNLYISSIYEDLPNQILLTGKRGIGKTFLLKKILNDQKEDIITIYLDISKIYGENKRITEEEILKELLQEMNNIECWRELYYLVNYLINQQKFITNVITY